MFLFPPNFYVEVLIPHVMMFVDMTLGNISSQVRSCHEWEETLREMIQLFLSSLCKNTGKKSVCKLQKELSPDADLASSLASQTLE
jgi:hypothetical protein